MSPAILAELDQVSAMLRDRPGHPDTMRARRQLLQRAHRLDSTEYILTGRRGRRCRQLTDLLIDQAAQRPR